MLLCCFKQCSGGLHILVELLFSSKELELFLEFG